MHLYGDVSLKDVLISAKKVLELIEFTVVGTGTRDSTAPISSQDGFGLVHASKMWPCSPQLMQEPVLILCWNSAGDNFCLAFIQESFFFCSWGGNLRFCPCEEFTSNKDRCCRVLGGCLKLGGCLQGAWRLSIFAKINSLLFPTICL